jgi:phospholipid-binding lipoprotein MlaA
MFNLRIEPVGQLWQDPSTKYKYKYTRINLMMTHISRFGISVLLLVTLLLTGCATVENRQDPFESMNRAIFEFNEVLDDKVVEPAARGYRAIVPDPIEMVIGNFFSNLNDVVVAANSLLQLKFGDALASGTRVLINTTFGMLGAVDIASDISVASDIDISKRDEDFGQTLGHYGVPNGPYLVLPFLGPSTFRDAAGIAVDGFFADPVSSIFLNDIPGVDLGAEVRVPVGTGRAIDKRAQLLDEERILEEAALDKYEFMRNSYLQNRESLINDGNAAEIDYGEDFEDDFEDDFENDFENNL